MRNRTSLTLLETAIMLLVFLVAAAFCLQAFAWADTASREGFDKDKAYLLAQSTAERFKSGEEIAPTQNLDGFVLRVTDLDRESVGLEAVRVEVYDLDGTCLAAICVARQQEGMP